MLFTGINTIYSAKGQRAHRKTFSLGNNLINLEPITPGKVGFNRERHSVLKGQMTNKVWFIYAEKRKFKQILQHLKHQVTRAKRNQRNTSLVENHIKNMRPHYPCKLYQCKSCNE